MLVRRDQSRPQAEVMRRVVNGRERVIATPVPQNVTKAELDRARQADEEYERNTEYWQFQTGR